MSYTFQTRVAFHDTDAMGVMHHSAHIKKFEEARVHWLRERNLDQYHSPRFDLVLAVTQVTCKYVKPASFDQLLSIALQVKKEGLKLAVRYAMYNENNDLLALGETTHVPLDANLKLVRYPDEFAKQLEEEVWTETWP